ncbi:MAG: membrane protease YdiL (CAAX protease family) [Cellvibrionaceae bacterium]|jgi:membrane protease YdiL (CAAX protease family)
MAEQLESDFSVKTNKNNGRILSRLWDWKDISLMLIIFFFLLMITSIAAFFLAGSRFNLNGEITADGDPFLLVMYSLGGTLLAMLLPYFGINALRKRHSLSALGLGAMPEGWLWPSVGLGVAGTVVRMGIGFVLLEQFPALEAGAEELSKMFVFEQSWQMVVVGLAATFIVPIYEEIFFRGVLHNGAANRLGVWGATLVSSTLFGLFHGFPIQIITAFLFGLIVGWLYEKTNSLWPVIICHLTNNGIVMGLTLISFWFGLDL